MFDLNKMKKNLKSNYINLPKHDTIDERVNWLIIEMEKRKNKLKDYKDIYRLFKDEKLDYVFREDNKSLFNTNSKTIKKINPGNQKTIKNLLKQHEINQLIEI